MQSVLVPTDGSEASQRALRLALQRAKGGKDSEVVIVNVQPDIASWQAHLVAQSLVDEHMERMSEFALASARDIAASSGVSHRFVKVSGDPASEIATVAGNQHATEIVMGTRGLGGIATLMLGSV
ncbi:MAG: universal stress protein, partial [Burkholderiales bacterium]